MGRKLVLIESYFFIHYKILVFHIKISDAFQRKGLTRSVTSPTQKYARNRCLELAIVKRFLERMLKKINKPLITLYYGAERMNEIHTKRF